MNFSFGSEDFDYDMLMKNIPESVLNPVIMPEFGDSQMDILMREIPESMLIDESLGAVDNIVAPAVLAVSQTTRRSVDPRFNTMNFQAGGSGLQAPVVQPITPALPNSPKNLNEHVCPQCSKTFTQRRSLTRHILTHSREKAFKCKLCEKSFFRNSHLMRHVKSHNADPQKVHTCEECQKTFTLEGNLKAHIRFHEKLQYPCPACDLKFAFKSQLLQHARTVHSTGSIIGVRPLKSKVNRVRKFHKNSETALGVFSKTRFSSEAENAEDMSMFLNSTKQDIQEKLEDEINDKDSIKWYTVVQVTMIKETGDDAPITPHFRSNCVTDLIADTLENHINEAFKKIETSLEEFVQNGSGWVLDKINFIELFSCKFRPLAASSYIQLPKKLSVKGAIVNIQNYSDQKCLVWCLLAHKMKITTKAERVSKYLDYEQEIQLGDIPCPVPLTKIPVIEKLNNLRINVFGYEEKEICPLHISQREDTDCINLLLIGDDTGNQHYCLIKDMSRLLGGITKHGHATHICYRCLHRFSTEKLLVEHAFYCNIHTPQNVKMPAPPNDVLHFTNIQYQNWVPYIIYADFEALLMPINSASPPPNSSYTENISAHIPCGYAYAVVGPDGKLIKDVVVYRGIDAVDHFLKKIIEEKELLIPKLLGNVSMCLTPEEKEDFKTATHCTICKNPLHNNKVRDHDHLSGKYRGALHKTCNLKYKQSKNIPVVFHNLKNYDSHHIMQGLGKIEDHEINIVATQIEKYISFRICRKGGPKISLQFIDSLQFMNSSLDKLVNTMEAEKFTLLEQGFPAGTPLDSIKRKGVYPYEYFTEFKKFDETYLPPAEAFFSTLTNTKITDEDYLHAKNVWDIFNIRNLGEYHDLYVKTDVLLLADVFQNFRNLCLKYYEIDCAHLMSAPGLAWQACLKMCKQPLELLTDLNMHLFIEKGIRGGISMISRRWGKANNPGLPEYDEEHPNTHIMYLDANNLYGWAMSQPLPHCGFEWVSPDTLDEEFIRNLPDDSQTGYILEVDLEYPEDLHETHNDYPLAPERMIVQEDMLSPHAKEILKNLNIGTYKGTEKLVPNLKDKEKYILHYRNLKLYLELGMKLKKIHKVIQFQQSCWLKSYIDFNTARRTEATSQFEKDFFKLLNNAVYGKSLECLRNRVNIELVNNTRRAEKIIASPAFKAFKIFGNNLVGVERAKTSLILNRPIYSGFTILDLSKLLMYKFHYQHIKALYRENAKLMFTDTDSVTYLIQTKNIYEDMMENQNVYDFSDYPLTHPLYSLQNKKVIGKFKDELHGVPAMEFVGLKPKMYSLLTPREEKKRAKGVSVQVVCKKLKHANYKECLTQLKSTREVQIRIAQESHKLYTVKLNKIALSPFDDKRYLLEDGITSYAYGHKKIRRA